MKVNRILVYRLGSVGDTVIVIPSLHLVARAFPDAERRILTNFPLNGRAAPMEAVIGTSGLVHGYFRYYLRPRNPCELWSLRQEIRQWSPELLVYLAEPRGFMKVSRDALFFRSCGIKNLIGVPYSEDLRRSRKLAGEDRFENEASRLARCISDLGEIDLANSASWNLHLNEEEEREADRLLWPEAPPYVTVNVGATVEVKDWGENNWASLVTEVSSRYPELGIVFIGVSDEKTRSDRIAEYWKGPKRNLCGFAPPRVSAAVIKRSILFMGHDSGAMHLAAAVGVPCVAVFSARSRPGEWFPVGTQHHVIYHQTDCYGCRLENCEIFEKKCLTSITVQEVFDAVCRKLNELGEKAGVQGAVD